MPQPDITVIVTQRERFSSTRASLEAVYQHTDLPFHLICVDGGSPRWCRRYLETESVSRGFTLIRQAHYLVPNRARNIGLAAAKTKYVVFLENDVLVSAGWLRSLLDCAETTGASIVTPLILQEGRKSLVVHCMGGLATIKVDHEAGTSTRHIVDTVHFRHAEPDDIVGRFTRFETAFAEFHCCLIRRDSVEDSRPFDELLTSQEDFDFCLSALRRGSVIYCEPHVVVTYQNASGRLDPSDLLFYCLRWSDDWEMSSYRHLREKWDIAEDAYFEARYERLGWRRRHHVVNPAIERLGLSDAWTRRLNEILAPVEALTNRCLSLFFAMYTGRTTTVT